jgi:hypothetical protein
MEMTAVRKGRKSKKRFSSLPSLALESSQKPRASHIPTAPAATTNFFFSQKMFNFNFDESVTYMPGTFCYRHPRSHNKASEPSSAQTIYGTAEGVPFVRQSSAAS